MSIRSATFSSTGTWVCPSGVSMVWATMIGGGGGGGAQTGLQDSKSGGGAGEFCHRLPVPVTPGTTYTVTIGAAGAGGIGLTNTVATDGGLTSFNGFRALGGQGSPRNDSQGQPGNGGGPNGAVNSALDGEGGTRETPTAFGGASGGWGGSSAPVAFNGGQQIGQYIASGGSLNGANKGGGGGGSTILAAGGAGGSGGAGESGNPGVSATVNGGGGGGASQDAGGGANAADGGAGAPGIAMLFWLQR